ncbi:hypothetical protein ACFE04_029582 [Oxalis oulophora]
MGHHCCSKQKVKKGLWSPEEDDKLIKHINSNGHGSWSSVPKLAGLERCGKSCRLRWINYLRPDLKRGSFTAQEEKIIIEVHRSIGNRWAQIAKHLPGRTDNEVKNFWHSYLKKKLMSQGIDPNTHNYMTNSNNNNIIAHKFPQHEPSTLFNPFIKDSLPSTFLNETTSTNIFQKYELNQNPNDNNYAPTSISSCSVLNRLGFGLIDDNYCMWENNFVNITNESKREEQIMNQQVIIKPQQGISSGDQHSSFTFDSSNFNNDFVETSLMHYGMCYI